MFANKVVFLTGASTGIGAATAVKFAREQANLVICGLLEDKMCKVSAKCLAAGAKVLCFTADVTDEDQMRKIVNTTIKTFGKLDVLINNAGILRPEGILDETVMESYDKVIAVNMRAPVFLTHICAPYLIQSQGNIVNISSIVAIGIVLQKSIAYITSKAGLSHFSRVCALELGPKGVRVNIVNPGLVRTDIAENTGQMDKQAVHDFFEDFVKSAPLGKICDPEEIADLIAFLASDVAKSITGSSHVMDNGELLVPTSNQFPKCSC